MANTQPGLDIVNDITKIKIGQVASSIFKEGMLKYKIRIEGMHSSLSEIIELSDGIPIFQNGINTKRFENGARVFCLSIGEAIGSVFVVGEVDDSNKKDTVTEGVLSGQNFL